jgi:APA family basic amino acid/polyamine antiporter
LKKLSEKEMSMESQRGAKTELKRTLDLFDATAISIGAIIGAGIFVVTGIVAGLAGPSLVISIVLAGVIASFSALSFSQLSAYMPKEGGGYQFTYRMVSPYTGFLSGWMWIFSYVFVGAAVSLGFANYLAALVPALSSNTVDIVAVAFCLLFTLLNYFGIRQSAMVNNVLVVSKILILVFFIILGLGFVNLNNFSPVAPNGFVGVLEGTSLIFFAYFGYARVTILAEEIKGASRNIPRAIILSLVLSTVLYALVGFVAVGLVGSNSLSQSASPLADAINVTRNSTAVFIVSLGAIIATASVLLMTILGVSRMTFAMARNGQLPTFLSRIHPKFQTPSYAILITGLVSSVLVFGGFSRIVAVSTFSLLFHHALVNLSAIRLKAENRRYPVSVSVIGFLLCLSLLVFLSSDAWIIGIAGLIVGSLYYLLGVKGRESQSDG